VFPLSGESLIVAAGSPEGIHRVFTVFTEMLDAAEASSAYCKNSNSCGDRPFFHRFTEARAAVHGFSTGLRWRSGRFNPKRVASRAALTSLPSNKLA
jgi:hypothetical protein